MQSFYRDHRRLQITSFPASMAKQSMADECDINILMLRYQKTGMLNHIIRYKGQYADVSNQEDFQSALQTLQDANQMFDSLPAKVREKFKNDPGQFLAFVENPENREAMAELGLLDRPPKKAEPDPPPPEPKTDPEPPTHGIGTWSETAF